ncbi:unknown [Bacteroides sp. CAG:633]|nr:unknown [Bacteroides sp. CAG:633]
MLEARNNFSRSNPLIAGICTSVSNTSNCSVRRASSSSSNCRHDTDPMPLCDNMAAVSVSWMRSSSISNTLFNAGLSGSGCLTSSATGTSVSCFSGNACFLLSASLLFTGKMGIRTVNVLPLPGTLSTSILPSSSCTSMRTMESPKPNPSFPCAPGKRVNSWKMRSRSAGSMPFPVSDTATTKRRFS